MTGRPVNSPCRYCGAPLLWAQLENGTTVPLDRSANGRVRVLPTAGLLIAVFLSFEELVRAGEQQRAARERGEQPEQLYALHSGLCRAVAKAQPHSRRPSRRKARR